MTSENFLKVGNTQIYRVNKSDVQAVNLNVTNVAPSFEGQEDSFSLNNKLKKAKRDNGLIERFYDFLKNKTGFGIG